MKKQTSVILLLQEMPISSHILVCFVHIILIVQLRFLFEIPRKFHHLLSPVQPTFKLLNDNCFRVSEVVQPSYRSFHQQKALQELQYNDLIPARHDERKFL